MDELEDNLGRVTVITGSLKVSRSFPIVSLDFFKNLREIQGISTEDIDIDIEKKAHYSLELLENENLQKLFPANSNVTITQRNGKKGTPKPGKAFIHYNQKLCPSEIKRLLEESKMFKPGENVRICLISWQHWLIHFFFYYSLATFLMVPMVIKVCAAKKLSTLI